jgi:hypothetical protein
MSASAFKKALQQLTTLVVKVELAGEVDAATREAGAGELERLIALHEALAAGSSEPLKHQGWYDSTVARASALFGPAS